MLYKFRDLYIAKACALILMAHWGKPVHGVQAIHVSFMQTGSVCVAAFATAPTQASPLMIKHYLIFSRYARFGAIVSASGVTWYSRRPSADVGWCLAAVQMHTTPGPVKPSSNT